VMCSSLKDIVRQAHLLDSSESLKHRFLDNGRNKRGRN
jgi:hypothetical protein